MPRVIHPRLRFIEPQLPSLVDQPPEGKHWIHEIKHDGYRCQVLIEPDRVRVFTRSGHDWTDRFTSIARAARGLQCKSAILDGEAVIQDESGVSDFEALRSAIQARSPNIILYVFDLLHLDGRDIRQQRLSDRRTLLKRLVGDDADSRIQVSDEFDGGGAALCASCRDMGLEGIVSKHAMAPYRSGRSKTWLKTKCFIEFHLRGGRHGPRPEDWCSPCVACTSRKPRLSYAGAAFIALGQDERTEFLA